MSPRDLFSGLKNKAKALFSDGKSKYDNERWKSTISATAKLLLCTVRDSADAFPPLKSVVGGLCFILENYEVRFTSHISLGGQRLSVYSSEQRVTNKR